MLRARATRAQGRRYGQLPTARLLGIKVAGVFSQRPAEAGAFSSYDSRVTGAMPSSSPAAMVMQTDRLIIAGT